MDATRFLSIALLLAFSCSVLAEELNVTFEDTRPISSAMDMLSKKMGYVITYEDPRYAYAEDLQDATSKARPSGAPGPRVFWPKTQKMELKGISMPKSTGVGPANDLLKQVLSLQSKSNSGGKFQLLRVNDTFHVVPTSVRNKEGRWIEQNSILDTPITIIAEKRTVRAMVEEICRQVGLNNNVKVLHMDPIVGNYLEDPTEVGAYNETARDVLLKTLSATGYRMGWNLYYIMSEGLTGYALTLRQMPKSTTPATPVTKPKSSVDTGADPNSTVRRKPEKKTQN